VEPQALRALLAKNIRRHAARKGLAMNALADFAAVSRSQLYDVLASRKAASVDWVAKVAVALEVQPWDLLAPAATRRSPRRG
jgi:hypothetical protein